MSEQLQIAISAVQRIELEKQRWRNRAELAEMENVKLQAQVERLESKLEDEIKRRNLWIENSKELVIERNEALAKAEGEK